MPENAHPQEVVLGLVRVISGDLPRRRAEDYLDANVKIHIDSANHRGIDLWYKWIHLIRNCGRIRDLRMVPCDVSSDPQNPGLVHLSIRWSGVERYGRPPIVTPATYRLKYLVENGRIIEIWTRKINYVFIFGRWIQYAIFYRLLLGWAILYFALLSLRGVEYRDDRVGKSSRSSMSGEGTFHRFPRIWQRSTGMKWTLLLFHLLFVLHFFAGELFIAGSLATWFVMQVGVHAGYHRYFTHRSFRTTPWFEFILGCAGCLAFQNGPLWWASKHRHHHRHTDTGEDLHSPIKGFWHSHVGWFFSEEAEDVEDINRKLVPDLLRPIPMWIESHQLRINGVYVSAALLAGGWSGLLNWCVVPVVLCWHATFATNSICHMVGSHPNSCYPQDSCLARNNFLVAIANLGEGWHNNHHANPSVCHHGFYRWYQLDVVFGILLILEKLGIVWRVKRKKGASRT